MKKIVSYIVIIACCASPLTMTSCTTDAYGNTAVTPEGAAAIGIGAAILGAAVADGGHHHHGGPGPGPHFGGPGAHHPHRP